MRNARRMIALMASMAVLSTGALILRTHAADQVPRPAAAPPANSRAAPVAKPGAPQVPEESATIRDDLTVAPDPKQSADNSVSFPNDI